MTFRHIFSFSSDTILDENHAILLLFSLLLLLPPHACFLLQSTRRLLIIYVECFCSAERKPPFFLST